MYYVLFCNRQVLVPVPAVPTGTGLLDEIWALYVARVERCANSRVGMDTYAWLLHYLTLHLDPSSSCALAVTSLLAR